MCKLFLLPTFATILLTSSPVPWFIHLDSSSFSPLLLHHVKLFIRSLIPQWCHLLDHCDMSFDAWYVGPISISAVPWSWPKPDVAVSSRCCCSATTWSRLSLKQKHFLEKKLTFPRKEMCVSSKKKILVSTVCFPVILWSSSGPDLILWSSGGRRSALPRNPPAALRSVKQTDDNSWSP